MNTFMLFYLIFINLIAFTMMIYDKHQARKGKWRIPEKRFFSIALLGGAIGAYIGMRKARHKTKHWTFVYGLPFCILLNLLSLFPLIYFSPSEWFTRLLSA